MLQRPAMACIAHKDIVAMKAAITNEKVEEVAENIFCWFEVDVEY